MIMANKLFKASNTIQETCPSCIIYPPIRIVILMKYLFLNRKKKMQCDKSKYTHIQYTNRMIAITEWLLVNKMAFIDKT